MSKKPASLTTVRVLSEKGTATPSPTSKPTPKKSTPTASSTPKKGRCVSVYIQEAEEEALGRVMDSLGYGSGVNRSHALRAGLHALADLPPKKLAELVESIKGTDGRRR